MAQQETGERLSLYVPKDLVKYIRSSRVRKDRTIASTSARAVELMRLGESEERRRKQEAKLSPKQTDA